MIKVSRRKKATRKGTKSREIPRFFRLKVLSSHDFRAFRLQWPYFSAKSGPSSDLFHAELRQESRVSNVLADRTN
jgi:hypothetical protein